MNDPSEPLARVELELTDGSRNARRYYAMTVAADSQLSLLPELAQPAVLLVIARGRLGRRAVVHRERFFDLEQLARRWRRLLATRLRHGYRVSVSDP